MIKEKIGIIGVGNMGGAILEGLFKKKIAHPGQVWVYDKIQEKASSFSRQWKVHQTASSAELVKQVRIIILAVKPQDLDEAAAAFKISLQPFHLVISILAGTPIAKVSKALGQRSAIVRAMPNLAAKVGEAVTALTGAKGHPLALAKEIFSGCGATLELQERHFDLVTATSGSGPAYFFLLMELLAQVGEENGLPKKAAQLLAVQTAVGAGLLAQSSPLSPAELRAMVTSKGGTTAAALKVLEDGKFSDIFCRAVEAARDRSRQLSQGG